MCNIKNIEQIRQQLWCDVYLLSVKEVSPLESGKGADLALKEFDGRFINVCQGSKVHDGEANQKVIDATAFKDVATKYHVTAEEVSENLKRMIERKPLRDATSYEDDTSCIEGGGVNPPNGIIFKAGERPPLRDTTTYIERGLNPKAYTGQDTITIPLIDWDAIYKPKKFTFAGLINSLLK